MKIIAIKTNDGYLISDNIKNEGYFSPRLSNLLFDSEKPSTTFKSDWFKVKAKPNKIERVIRGGDTNKRYELKDKSLSSTFKEVYTLSEVENEEEYATPSFSDIKGLYEYKFDKSDDSLEEVLFDWEEILEIEEYKEPTGFSYKALGTWNKEISPVTDANLKYDILSQVLTPRILLHNNPCSLSRKETYDIIRKFIKDNINSQVAEITSDYDFCFTVKKKIRLDKPHVYEVDVNNLLFGKKRKPKYETRTRRHELVEVFNMCPSAYQSYKLIEPFKADSQDDMREYIENYLNHLIGVINEPLVYCECCSGTGVKIDKL
jgi:hypothetical protein